MNPQLISMFADFNRTEEATFRGFFRMTRPNIDLMSNYIDMRNNLYQLVSNVLEGQSGNEPFAPTIQIQVPPGWNESVVVAPSAEQIEHASQPIPEGTTLDTCAICQDALTQAEGGTILRNCSHQFHRGCLTEWFSRSVRCPVCRNDIRESNNE